MTDLLKVDSVSIQPIIKDGHNVLRLKANEIVSYLLKSHPHVNLNTLARMNFTDEDRQQFAMLIGYSISGFSELPYVSDELFYKAEKISEAL